MSRSLLIAASAGSLVVGLAACGQSAHTAAQGTPEPSVTPTVSSSIPPLPSRAPEPTKKPARAWTKATRPSITIKRDTLHVSGPVGPGATVAVRNQDGTPHTVTLHAMNLAVKVAGRGSTTLRAPKKAGRYAVISGGQRTVLVVK